MARKKKQLDNLSLDMIQCKKDGFGCHYGRWKATQERKEIKKEPIPEGWKLCPWCGSPFRATNVKRFCGDICREKAYYEKNRDHLLAARKLCYRRGKERNADING